jgi:nitric oxide reductase subunit B
MGTTIGINSMILFAACFELLGNGSIASNTKNRWITLSFWTTQSALLVFWVSLNLAGIKKGIWQMSEPQIPFSTMMKGLHLYFGIFFAAGLVLATALFTIVFILLRSYWTIPGKELQTENV